MNVSIWDIKNEKWLSIFNVKQIVTLSKDLFKIDGVTYYTTEYELNFIHCS